ncbi:MAG: hypothetical protein L6R37_005878 [Teloschistes peruensis]|nr:MAG: hypothetical protein L6R37_005878 [Teloschistes peruensis]
MPLPLDPSPSSHAPIAAVNGANVTNGFSSTSSPPADPSSLPPEALELATRLFNAARAGDVAMFQQAIPAGLPVNLTNDKGDTVLMLAAYHTHPSLVQFLLSQSADPNTLNERGQSPLAGAIFKAAGAPGAAGSAATAHDEGTSEADQVVQLLLDAGADVDKGQPSARESVEMFRVERWRRRICGG